MTSSLSHLATATATTKRNPAAVGNKVGDPVAHLSAFDIIPPVPNPADNDPVLRLQSVRQTWLSYTEGAPDIRKGDELTTGGVAYRVKDFHPWPILIEWSEIVLEKVLQS